MLKRLTNILLNVLLYCVLAISLIFTASTAEKGYTNFCGYTVIRVLSNSMTKPTEKTNGIKKGDARIIASSSSYSVGDIIAFYYERSTDDRIILYHEIVGINEDGSFITKGSANSMPEMKATKIESIIGKQVSDTNVKFLVSVEFRVSLILVAYILSMTYLTMCLIHVLKSEKFDKRKNRNIFTKSKRYFIDLLLCVVFALSAFTMNVYASKNGEIFATNLISFVIKTWEGENKLPDEVKKNVHELEEAINNLGDPSNKRGSALKEAIEARKGTSTDFLGNMDMISNVSDNLDDVMTVSNDCTYIIKVKGDHYILYLTYTDHSRLRLYERFGPVYETYFEIDETGEFRITKSTVGTATKTYYDAKNGQYQSSFNTDDYIEY